MQMSTQQFIYSLERVIILFQYDKLMNKVTIDICIEKFFVAVSFS